MSTPVTAIMRLLERSHPGGRVKDRLEVLLRAAATRSEGHSGHQGADCATGEPGQAGGVDLAGDPWGAVA